MKNIELFKNIDKTDIKVIFYENNGSQGMPSIEYFEEKNKLEIQTHKISQNDKSPQSNSLSVLSSKQRKSSEDINKVKDPYTEGFEGLLNTNEKSKKLQNEGTPNKIYPFKKSKFLKETLIKKIEETHLNNQVKIIGIDL